VRFAEVSGGIDEAMAGGAVRNTGAATAGFLGRVDNVAMMAMTERA
jgi:hypothetical protein